MPAVGVPTVNLVESFVFALVSRQTATAEAAAARGTKAIEAVAAGMMAVAAAGSEKFAESFIAARKISPSALVPAPTPTAAARVLAAAPTAAASVL